MYVCSKTSKLDEHWNFGHVLREESGKENDVMLWGRNEWEGKVSKAKKTKHRTFHLRHEMGYNGNRAHSFLYHSDTGKIPFISH